MPTFSVRSAAIAAGFVPARREGELCANLKAIGARGIEIERNGEEVVVAFTLDAGSHEAARQLGEKILNEFAGGLWPGGIVISGRLPSV
jgi:hypothetical protein